MKKFIFYDRLVRNTFKIKEFDIVFLKLVLNNKRVPLLFKNMLKADFVLKKYPHLSRVRNICSLTGRPRSVYRKFKLSRVVMRELGSQGVFLGLQKSSW